jgi:hypothetical protein
MNQGPRSGVATRQQVNDAVGTQIARALLSKDRKRPLADVAASIGVPEDTIRRLKIALTAELEEKRKDRERRAERKRQTYKGAVSTSIYRWSTHYVVQVYFPGEPFRRQKRFPLDTPIETLERCRDEMKQEARTIRAQMARQTQERRHENERVKRKQVASGWVRVDTEIWKKGHLARVYWSEPDPESKKSKERSQRFHKNEPVADLVRFRAEKTSAAERAWELIREERKRPAATQRVKPRYVPERARVIPGLPNIFEVRRRDNDELRGYLLSLRIGHYPNGKRRTFRKRFPVGTPPEEIVRVRDAVKPPVRQRGREFAQYKADAAAGRRLRTTRRRGGQARARQRRKARAALTARIDPLVRKYRAEDPKSSGRALARRIAERLGEKEPRIRQIVMNLLRKVDIELS